MSFKTNLAEVPQQPSIVRDLQTLIEGRIKFATVLADPPWQYLELYGREEQPNTEWTVYGNQV